MRGARWVIVAALGFVPPGTGLNGGLSGPDSPPGRPDVTRDVTDFYVSTSGADTDPGTELLPWRTIQHAASVAPAGARVNIRGGVYNEKIAVTVSGSGPDGMIVFRGQPGETAILDGTGIPGDQLILIHDQSFVRVEGLELRNNLDQSFGTGIWVTGGGEGIEIVDNVIHDMRALPAGGDAMAVSVYGTDPVVALTDILIAGNLIYDCEPGHSEALVLNGNVDGFEIADNVIRDVDNIGIDMIGGEGTCPSPALDAARNGVCRGNVVERARSNYGGGYAAGIYVDGGRDILIEGNRVSECDLGMEIGCENQGLVSSGITVRNNVLYNNDKAGLGFGGYNYSSTGKVWHSVFRNNTVYHNDVLGTGAGELWIQEAEACTVTANIFYSTGQNRLLTTTVDGSAGNVIDGNLWFAPGGASSATVDWDGEVYVGYAEYLAGTGNDAASLFADPVFLSPGLPAPDIRLDPGSPGVDAADPDLAPEPGETDFLGGERLLGAAMDVGAVETVLDEPGPPAPVTLISAVAGGLNAMLTWSRSPAPDFERYRIFGGPAQAPDSLLDSPLDSIELNHDTIATIAGLAKNTEYRFSIGVLDRSGESSLSNELTVTTYTPGAPAAPELIGAIQDSAGIVLTWKSVEGAAGYGLQVSADVDFLPPLIVDTTLADTAAAIPLPFDSTVYRWRVNSAGDGGTSPWSGRWDCTNVPGGITTVVSNRWNLVSLAGNPVESATDRLFPTAVSQAFAFDSAYSSETELETAKGYWIKFNGRQSVTYTGDPIGADTIDVTAGWNIIGAISAPVSASDVMPVGTAIVSPFYGYDAGYVVADSLLPGKAYWVKVSSAGAVTIDAGGGIILRSPER